MIFKLALPDLETRAHDYDRWLRSTPQHPRAAGNFLAPVASDSTGRTDLGLWNVYANPDLPAPQPALEKLLNPSGRRSHDDVLASTVGREILRHHAEQSSFGFAHCLVDFHEILPGEGHAVGDEGKFQRVSSVLSDNLINDEYGSVTCSREECSRKKTAGISRVSKAFSKHPENLI